MKSTRIAYLTNHNELSSLLCLSLKKGCARTMIGPRPHSPKWKAAALMKPQVYTKSIAELVTGDVIYIRGGELQPRQPEARYQATVVTSTRVSALRHRAALLLDGQTAVVSTTDLPVLHKIDLASLDGQEMVWVDLPNLEVGDCIRWLGYFVPVEHIELRADQYLVTVTDPQGEIRRPLPRDPTLRSGSRSLRRVQTRRQHTDGENQPRACWACFGRSPTSNSVSKYRPAAILKTNSQAVISVPPWATVHHRPSRPMTATNNAGTSGRWGQHPPEHP